MCIMCRIQKKHNLLRNILINRGLGKTRLLLGLNVLDHSGPEGII